jgi:hypothetical protein
MSADRKTIAEGKYKKLIFVRLMELLLIANHSRYYSVCQPIAKPAVQALSITISVKFFILIFFQVDCQMKKATSSVVNLYNIFFPTYRVKVPIIIAKRIYINFPLSV